ncbi:hypothetical protein [Methylomonas sp. HYX-M1]|uniref:hypothetical protein n=1 Tax=Methylomonas sp. HYX-M1 TaxID=3139307 RepID=UPI00345C02C8
MTQSIIQPKKPSGNGWSPAQLPSQFDNLGYPAALFIHPETGLTVISAVEVPATEPGAEPLGPEYHISISKYGQRCTSQEAKWVLRQFKLEDAEEDNHVPSGKVRNFWRPVADRLSGYQCPCKASEPAMVEDKGDFVWRGVP